MMAIDNLIAAAKRKDWDAVDQDIPQVCNIPQYKQWAFEQGIKDGDGNVRDLAVSILEKAETLEPEVHAPLLQLMTSDKNRYVRFRSAFALAGHAPKYHKREVLLTLKQAQQDADVAEIAKAYIKKVVPYMKKKGSH